MKDGGTHLAHKTEHAVDLDTGAVIGVTVQPADKGDTTTMIETLIAAAEQVEAVLPENKGIEKVVTDKVYHSTERIVNLERLGLRSYISEPIQRRRRWRSDDKSGTRFTTIVDASEERKAKLCSVGEQSAWNVPLSTFIMQGYAAHSTARQDKYS
jgi:hypothetical protein